MHSSINKAALGAGVSVAALALATGVAAQEGATPVSTVDEIIVTGQPIVGSQRAALLRQREADNVVSVIAADTVGQFPDQNAAAALSRLPAVAVQRDQGQERYLQIRGAPNRWTSVSIDGINIVGVDEGGNQRAFRFDAVPAVILSALEVNKTLTPDMSAESIVARVDLQTYSPFDRRGIDLQGDLGRGEMNLGGGDQEQYSLRASWSGDTFGVFAAISRYRRDQITDNRETVYDAAGAPTALDYRQYFVFRETSGAMAGMEWRPAAGQRLFVKALETEFTDNEERNQYVIQVGSGVGTRTAAAGDLVGVPVRGTANDGYYGNLNRIATLGGDHTAGDWDLAWRVNYSEVQNTTDLPIVLSQQLSSSQRFAVRYDRSNPLFPILDIATQTPGATPGSFVRGTPIQTFSPASFGLNLLLPLSSRTDSEGWVYKLDGVRDAELFGRPIELRLGFEYDDRTVEGSILSGAAPVVALTQLLPLVGRSFNYADYLTAERWDAGFPSGFGFTYVDNKKMRRDIDAGLGALAAAGRYNAALNISPADRYTIDERLTSAYGSASFDAFGGRMVAGLRVERMEQAIDGFLRVGSTVTPLSVDSDDLDLFPSLNARWDLNEDTVLRAALVTGIARPGYGAVRTGASVSDVSRTIAGGNPTLEPEKTWGGDVSLERYLPGAGVVSAGAFVRLVDNVLYDAVSTVTSDIYDAPGIDRTGYIYTSTQNGDSGHLYGLELSWQQQFVFLPGLWSGFGVQANVALLDGEFDTRVGQTADFPGTSKTVTNLSVYYEKYGLSARLSHQWRDDWLDSLGGLGSGEYRAGYESLDLSLRYALTDSLTLFVDGNNLTDETYVAFEGDPSRPSEVEQIGARWMAGVRFNF